MTETTYTVADLHTAAATTEPVYVKTGDRSVRTVWAIPGGTEDAHGCYPHADLYVTHDSDRKIYRAEFRETAFVLTDIGHRELITLTRTSTRARTITEPAARFNARKFAAFADAARTFATTPAAV